MPVDQNEWNTMSKTVGRLAGIERFLQDSSSQAFTAAEVAANFIPNLHVNDQGDPIIRPQDDQRTVVSMVDDHTTYLETLVRIGYIEAGTVIETASDGERDYYKAVAPDEE